MPGPSIAQTNWKYDESVYHKIQSGPQRTGSNLDLIDTYIVISSGYTPPSGIWPQQSFYGVNDVGADFGKYPIVTNISGFLTKDWRFVPPPTSGYWTNYEDSDVRGSGLLSAYEGFRYTSNVHTANANVQGAFGPQPGLKEIGAYTWFGSNIPDNQNYSPFNTPEGNTSASDGGGITGGPGTYERVKTPMLTNPTQDASGDRAAWRYNYPAYCKTYAEASRSTKPGEMATVTRDSYRGRSTRYVMNYGSMYGKLGEGVRNIVRSYSTTVNSSNQKGV